MSTFNIENLLSNAKYSFQLSKTLSNEELSYDIEFSTPKYPISMDKVKLFYKLLSTNTKKEPVINSASYFITKYVVLEKPANKNASTVRFFINSSDSTYSSLSKGDKIQFKTNAASALANFNTSSAIINQTSFKTPNQKYVDIINMVSSSFNPSSKGNVTANESYPSPYTNYFVEFSIKDVKTDRYQIFVDGQSEFLTNELMFVKDAVQDIIIFAYASAANKSIKVESLEKRIISVDSVINSKTPPLYAAVNGIFAKQSSAIHTQKWTTNVDGAFVYFWAAVARYKKDKNANWNGEWLQLDDNNNVIWTEIAREVK